VAEGKSTSKPPKETFLERTGHRLKDAAGLGRLAFEQPRAVPGELRRRFKRFLRALWDARGGGLYACGFVITFLWLEASTIVGEIASSSSLASFVTDELIEFVFRFSVQSLVNTILALVWPAYVIDWSPAWGGAALVALYFIFPRFIKPTITRWLFDGDSQVEEPQEEPRG
jgi:hypothetical protein